MPNTVEKTTLVSLFHTREHASKAITDLKAAGIPADAIQNLAGEAGSSAAPEQSLASLRTLNLPEKDLQILSEGLKNGGSLIVVRADHAAAEKAEQIFENQHAKQIDERALNTGTPAATQNLTEGSAIPVIEEELLVGKRRVQRGGVRVFSRLVETPVEEQINLSEEHVTMERHAVNRPISSAELDAMQNQSIEVQEMSEEAVVNKTSRVVEEISIGKDVTERTQQVKDSVRHTEVEVEQLAGEKAKGAVGRN